MANCDNNCNAVAKLHESAVNLIAYSEQINKWVNGGQNETVNVGGVNTPTLRNLAMAIKQLVGVYPDERTISIDTNKKIYVKLTDKGGIHIGPNGLYIDSSDFLQLGGGLAKDPSGNIYVDFASMPTDKFEAMLKSIRVPIWLTKNFHVYVDCGKDTSGNYKGQDKADAGYGLSAAKPFRSIQYAVDFVCDNYNLSTHHVYIHLAAGTYDLNAEDQGKAGILNLGGYSTNTGIIVIEGPEIETDGGAPLARIICRDTSMIRAQSANTYHLRKLGFVWTVTPEIGTFATFLNVQKGNVKLDCFQIRFVASGFSCADQEANKSLRCIMPLNGGKVEIANNY